MAHFIGYLQGARSRASRLGHKASGIVAQARGWNIGGKVVASTDSQERDVVEFYIDGGSNERTSERLIARAVLTEAGTVWQFFEKGAEYDTPSHEPTA